MRIASFVLVMAPLLGAMVELCGCTTPAAGVPQAQAPAPTPAPPPPGAMQPVPSSAPSAAVPVPPMSAQSVPLSPNTPPPQPAAVAAPKRPAAPTANARASASKPVPAGTMSAPKPATPSPTSTAAVASAPAPATLNLTDLEQRLRDTKAIGVFTKLSLKNQVDDLLDEFRSLYKGAARRPSAELRQRYDQLLAKVLDLLKSGDPKLAYAIASSREAIWGILADPDKFANI